MYLPGLMDEKKRPFLYTVGLPIILTPFQSSSFSDGSGRPVDASITRPARCPIAR